MNTSAILVMYIISVLIILYGWNKFGIFDHIRNVQQYTVGDILSLGIMIVSVFLPIVNTILACIVVGVLCVTQFSKILGIVIYKRQ